MKQVISCKKNCPDDSENFESCPKKPLKNCHFDYTHLRESLRPCACIGRGAGYPELAKVFVEQLLRDPRCLNVMCLERACSLGCARLQIALISASPGFFSELQSHPVGSLQHPWLCRVVTTGRRRRRMRCIRCLAACPAQMLKT